MKEYESIGIQNDGSNIEVKKKKQSQPSIRLSKEEINNKNKFSQRKSNKNSLNMKERESKINAKPIKKIS